jgi:hypothetical protein
VIRQVISVANIPSPQKGAVHALAFIRPMPQGVDRKWRYD